MKNIPCLPSKKILDSLAPCPFCGDKADMLKQEYGWLVLCWNRCGGQMRVHTKFVSQAVASWNLRNNS